jgi:hypothetical protein
MDQTRRRKESTEIRIAEVGPTSFSSHIARGMAILPWEKDSRSCVQSGRKCLFNTVDGTTVLIVGRSGRDPGTSPLEASQLGRSRFLTEEI